MLCLFRHQRSSFLDSLFWWFWQESYVMHKLTQSDKTKIHMTHTTFSRVEYGNFFGAESHFGQNNLITSLFCMRSFFSKTHLDFAKNEPKKTIRWNFIRRGRWMHRNMVKEFLSACGHIVRCVQTARDSDPKCMAAIKRPVHDSLFH